MLPEPETGHDRSEHPWAGGKLRQPEVHSPVTLYTIAEAAGHLRVPEGWLRKKVTAGAVPHTRLGKHVRFTATHLLHIVAVGEVELTSRFPQSRQGLSRRARVGGEQPSDSHASVTQWRQRLG